MPRLSRPSRLGVLAITGATALSLAAPLPSLAHADRTPPAERPAHRRIERLSLRCVHRDDRSVQCDWRDPRHPRAVSVRLLRAVGSDAREVIYRGPADAGGFTDATIPADATRVRYALASYNARGHLVGLSHVEVVVFGS
jgi:hypothetical protein